MARKQQIWHRVETKVDGLPWRPALAPNEPMSACEFETSDEAWAYIDRVKTDPSYDDPMWSAVTTRYRIQPFLK